MSIIVKFILKNIYEKKFRTALVILSIMISSALFFASSAISGTFEKMIIERMRQQVGTTEIIIHRGEKSTTSFLYTDGAKNFSEMAQYVIGAINSTAYYHYNNTETAVFNLTGIDFNDMQTMNPAKLEQEYNLFPFEGKKIVLSKGTAEKYGLKPGDSIELELDGNRIKFIVSGIAYPQGIFIDNGLSSNVMVPREVLSSIYNARGKVSTIYIKLKNPMEIERVIKELSRVYERFTVREPFSKADIKRQTDEIATPFLLMTIIVSFMSIYIIHSSFKVITLERLPVIGTFRSIGAARKTTNLVLLSESLVYGITGGLLGCLLGIGVLYVMANLIMPSSMKGFAPPIYFTSTQLAASFFLAVVMCLASSLLPIFKVSKIPIKDIVLNATDKPLKKKSSRLILGLIIQAVSLAAPMYAPDSFALVVDALCIIASISSSVMLIPYFTGLLVKLFEKFFVFIFGNEGILAAKNLRENKSILNSISLLSIGISTLLMINTVSYSVLIEITKMFGDAKYDITMRVPNADRSIENVLAKADGVGGAYGSLGVWDVEVYGKDDKIVYIEGLQTDRYLDFWDLRTRDDPHKAMEELDTGRNILLTMALKNKFKVEKGDTITLLANKQKKYYKVIGFFDTLDYNGSYALISDRYLRSDFNIRYFGEIFIKADKEPDEVAKTLRSQFSRKRPRVSTMKELEQRNLQNNAQMFSLLQGFSVMTLFIGILGVVNNLLISFMERRRFLAMFRSIGMSKVQIVKMVVLESFTGGLIGGITGVISGLILIFIVPYVLAAISGPIPMHLSTSNLVISFLAGLGIMLLASISPAFKSSKLNIIHSIKFE